MRIFLQYCLRRAAFWRVKAYVLAMRLFTSVRYKNKAERKKKFKQLRYLAERKYLSRYEYAAQITTTKSPTDAPKIIWTCWWQGEENMPPVAKRCVESLQRYFPDYKLIIISEENVNKYAEFPKYIWEKYRKGYITRTQFSDLLRIVLLTTYGGIWADATVFLTAPLPPKIINAPFFAYHSRLLYQWQSWFLKAAADNLILHNLKNLMFEYWKYETKMVNYFLVYLAFDTVVSSNPICAEQWGKTPLFYDDCYELERNFFEPYSAEKWLEIKATTPLHKLSWKYKKEPTPDSFLQYLIDGKLES